MPECSTCKSNRLKSCAWTQAPSSARYFDDQPHHADYLEFSARLTQAGKLTVYSELLDLELAQMCIKTARTRTTSRDEATRLGHELLQTTFAAWREIFGQTDSVRATLAGNDQPDLIGSPIRAAAFYLMAHHGIESYDATHAATSITFGAPILTADKGFADIPSEQLELITHAESVDAFRLHPSQA